MMQNSFKLECIITPRFTIGDNDQEFEARVTRAISTALADQVVTTKFNKYSKIPIFPIGTYVKHRYSNFIGSVEGICELGIILSPLVEGNPVIMHEDDLYEFKVR